MSKLLNQIMDAGIKTALFEQCSRRLWNAKLLLEHASKDRFKEFERCVQEARKEIDEAEEIYTEWNNRSALSEESPQ